MTGLPSPKHNHERDYIERTIATVRNHRGADNCWPQWANVLADEIESCWADLEQATRERDEARYDEQVEAGIANEFRDAVTQERERAEHAEGLLAQQQERSERLAETLTVLLKVAEFDVIGYPDCAACKDAYVRDGGWWLNEIEGHDEDCPLHAVEQARAALAVSTEEGGDRP